MDSTLTAPAPHADNQRLRKLAHERLDIILDAAERENLSGKSGVEVQHQAGRFANVRRLIDASEK